MEEINLPERIEKIKVECGITLYSPALKLFREVTCKDYQLQVIHHPEIKYNSAKDVYTISFNQGGKHTYKIKSDVVTFISQNVNNPNAYFNFRLDKSATIDDVIVELW